MSITKDPVTMAQNVASVIEQEMQAVLKNAEQVYIPIDDIYIDLSENVRQENSYTEEDIDELAEQIIASGGVIQNIVVQPIQPEPENGNKKYMVFMGVRRCLALRKIAETQPDHNAVKRIPARILAKGGMSDNKRAAIRGLQILENIARKAMSPIEIAQASSDMMNQGGVTQQTIAKALGVSVGYLSKLVQLLEFPREIRDLIHSGEISFSNAYSLVSHCPKADWLNMVPMAKSHGKEEFEKHLKKVYGSNANKTEGTQSDEGTQGIESQESEGGNKDDKSDDKGSVQRSRKMMSTGDIEKYIVPFIQTRIKDTVGDKEKRYTESEMMSLVLDAVNALRNIEGTKLAASVAPFITAMKKKEEDATSAEKAIKALDKFLRNCVSLAKKDYTEKQSEHFALAAKDPSAQPPVVNESLVAVIRAQQALYKKSQEEAASDDKEKAKAAKELLAEKFGFSYDLSNAKQFAKDIIAKWQVVNDEAKKRAEAKAEAKKKADEEERQKMESAASANPSDAAAEKEEGSNA